MYKELIISFVIIAIIFAGDFITQKITRTTIEDIKGKLSTLKNELEEENGENAKKIAEEISNKLYSAHSILAYYIEHDELEKMETDFTVCKSYVMTKEFNDAISELERTEYVLNHVTDKYSFTLENIF